MIIIKQPELLHIRDGATLYYGADQRWYRTLLQRKAGCGPTCAAHLIWYFAQTRPVCRALTARAGETKAGFLELMEDIWRYVTPGLRGLNKTSMFTDGMLRYAGERGVTFRQHTLGVPPEKEARPSDKVFFDFLEHAIYRDLPVAFLNLHNGGVAGLDTWHWVTLIGVDPEAGTALMYDQGIKVVIDVRRWLRDTTAGGGLIRIEPVE